MTTPELRAAIEAYTVDTWRDLFSKHLDWAKQNKRVSGAPKWDEGGLNAIGVRMNPINRFYVKDKEAWNDYLVLILDETRTLFNCTVDPAVVHENPKGIAHLLEGCWDSYVRGFHKSKNRRALVQRTNPVRVVRTDGKGKILMEDWGYFGINIHNASGVLRPSAGCTVIQPKGGFMIEDENYRRMRDIINAAPDRPSRTYCLMNHTQLADYMGISVATDQASPQGGAHP